MNIWVKKLSAVALTAGMLMSNISYLPMTSSVVNAVESEVEEEVHIWDGTTDVSWYDDEETEFHISTSEQLAGLSKLTNIGKTMEGKTFILDNDIYLNDVSTYDEWGITTPPQNRFKPMNTFSGSILGNDYRIVGVYNEDSSVCLISELSNACIFDLHLEDVAYYQGVWCSCECGGLAKKSSGSKIINCSTQGNIHCLFYSSYDSQHEGIGGLIGNSSSDFIMNCSNDMDINVFGDSKYFVGGICGSEYNSKIFACINSGEIKSNNAAGGICGYAYKGIIKQCKNNGIITGGNNTGGILGYIYDLETKVNSCYNVGKITGENSTAGICGYYRETGMEIENAYNIGSINNGDGCAITSSGIVSENTYYLSGTAKRGTYFTPDPSIAKTEANMKKESFADSLGEAFYYVEGEFPKLAFEVGRTISNFDKTSLAFKEFGETQTLSLDTTYLGEPEWVSSDTSVATVDSDGVVTAVGNGTAMIYALCSDSKAACSVTVGYDYYLSDNELTLKKGRVHDLSVLSASTGKEVTDIDVEWSSSDDSIVSVDSEGKITTNAVGTAAITAKVADLELSCIVSIYEYQVPAVIVPDDENAPKLSETDFTISTIDSKLLSVENYSDSITWVSANTSVAKVSKNGLVKGVSEGNTMIYALLSDGRCLKANAVVTKSEYTMGDVNLDGEFNVTDAVLLQKWLLVVPDVELKCWENADFYADGKLDVFDLCMMKNALITK